MGKNNNTTLFHDLAAVSGAGIAMSKAVQIVASSHSEITVWPDVIRSLNSGDTLSKALGDSGLVSKYEREIIAAAEFSGRTEQALTELAASSEKRSRRVSQLRHQLILPFSVLLIGVVATTIVALIKHPELPVFPMMIQAIFILTVVAVLTKIIFILLQKDASRFIAHIGLFNRSRFYKHVFEQVFFGILLWHIKSGVDFKIGFLRVSKLVDSTLIKKRLENASLYCGQGIAITESIKRSKLPITYGFTKMLTIAETSGRWEETVEHYLMQQQMMLDLKIDSMLEWTPRIYYVLILVFIGSLFP